MPARRLLADARDLHVDLTVELAEALVDWRTGHFDQADRRFADALDTFHGVSPEPVAWLHLQRGLLDLDRGRDAEAAVHYAAADAALDGWWLVEEHLAELDMRSGRWARAARPSSSPYSPAPTTTRVSRERSASGVRSSASSTTARTSRG